MTMFSKFLSRRAIATILIAGHISLASGCATMAHRHASSSHSSQQPCQLDGDPCPWLVGDALLLIPGIVPGVIAFIIDFSNGEWKHTGDSSVGQHATSDAPENDVIAGRH